MADTALDTVQTSVYTKPDELCVNVAYEVLELERVDNKQRPNEKSNRAFLKYSSDVKLMFYLPNKYKFLTDADIEAYNDKITKKQTSYYVVSKGLIGSCVVTDLITKAKKEAGSFPDFHPNIHKAKKDRSDYEQDFVSPSKRLKRE